MTTPLTTGYSPELTPAQRCRNLAAEIEQHIGREQTAELLRNMLSHYGEVTGDFERELTGIARALVNQPAPDASRNTLGDSLQDAGFGSGGVM